jgi:hypothetical protein
LQRRQRNQYEHDKRDSLVRFQGGLERGYLCSQVNRLGLKVESGRSALQRANLLIECGLAFSLS